MLAAWYPLISDCHNQGVLNAELTEGVSGATFGPGILGGCLTNCGRCYWDATTTASILNNDAMTFAFWIYPTDATGTSRTQEIFGNTGTTTTNNRHYTIFQYPTCNDLHISWQVEGSSTGSVCQVIWSGVFPSNTWTHCCITYQNPNGKLYINGQLHATFTGNYNNSNFAFKTQALVSWNNRKLCDFRIYTHCLSALEVKQISQALLLHYPMTGGGRGCANLVPGQAKYTSVSPRVLTTTATDGNSWLSGSAFEVKPSTTYTYSVCCDGQIATKHATDGSEPGTFSMWLYLCNDGTTKNWQGGQYDSPICFTSSNYNHTQVGNRHIWQYTTTSTQRYMSIRLNNYGPGTVTNNYWEFKIEESPKFTPYLPNVNESEYTYMGYNNNTEYDTSGYCYNGTRNGTFSWSSDTPRYSVSTVFDSNNRILTQNLSVGNIWSYGLWFKSPTGSRSWESVALLNNNAGDADTQLGFYTYRANNVLQTTANGQWNSSVAMTYDGNWHHFFATFDGSTLKTYIDGVLKDTKSITAELLSKSNLCIGSRYRGGSYDCNYIGQLSDFRLYATCLTADDIKELYNTSASLTNNGRLLSYQFVES